MGLRNHDFQYSTLGPVGNGARFPSITTYLPNDSIKPSTTSALDDTISRILSILSLLLSHIAPSHIATGLLYPSRLIMAC